MCRRGTHILVTEFISVIRVLQEFPARVFGGDVSPPSLEGSEDIHLDETAC